MVSTMPTMRPMMFSALKALDPLDEEEERGEHDDRQPDVDEVEHGALLGVTAGVACGSGRIQ
jgi:hypothetical protein